MAESLAFSKTSDRKTIYDEIAPQIDALTSGETDLTANLANICAVLKEAFGFFWVGFYLKKRNQLVLNAFKVQSLARGLILTKAFADILIGQKKRLSCRMLMNFPVISLALRSRNPKSFCRFLRQTAKFLAF